MEGQTVNSDNWAELVRTLIETHPIWFILLLVFVGVSVFGFIYLLLKERFSQRAKDIAEASKLMAESLKQSTESLATAPQIVTSFSTLMENTIKRELAGLDQRISHMVDDEFESKAKILIERGEQASKFLEEIRKIKDEITKTKETAENQYTQLNKQLSTIQSVLPDYETWKSIADPELLIRRLGNMSWNEGKDLIAQIKKLVEDSEDHPEQIPAKYIELAGDWCRRHNQFPLALWFYKQAVNHDHDRISAKVELNALLAEFVPSERGVALKELEQLAFSKRIQLSTILHIFNVVIEIDRYDILSETCSKLLEFEIYKSSSNQAALYRNRAIAKQNLSPGLKTEEMWSDTKRAKELNPNDEHALRVYSNWLIEDGNYKEAIENCIRLIRLHPTDVNYYILLSRAYSGNGSHMQARKVLELARSVASSDIDRLNLSDAEATVNKAAIRDDPSFLNDLNEQRQDAQCDAT